MALADVADARKARSRTALERLAGLRPDEASRALVSRALDAPLLDPDAGIRDSALDAVRVWATPENAATLVKLLGGLHGERAEGDARTGDRVARALITIGPGAEEAAVSLLKSPDGLVRRQACWVLAEIGSAKSVPSLEAVGGAYVTVDPDFYRQTRAAVARMTARQ
jgi:HEAT repeat protein